MTPRLQIIFFNEKKMFIELSEGKEEGVKTQKHCSNVFSFLRSLMLFFLSFCRLNFYLAYFSYFCPFNCIIFLITLFSYLDESTSLAILAYKMVAIKTKVPLEAEKDGPQWVWLEKGHWGKKWLMAIYWLILKKMADCYWLLKYEIF